jgi:hypothetical protein
VDKTGFESLLKRAGVDTSKFIAPKPTMPTGAAP